MKLQNLIAAAAIAACAAAPCLAGEAEKKAPEAPSPAARANAIAFKLYSAEARKGGNVFFSPYSIYGAFAAVYEGAKGSTAGEMASVFSFPPKAGELRAGVAGLKKALASSLKGAVFTQADSFWAQDGYKFRKDYLKTLRADYSAQALNADFRKNPEEARRRINMWTENATKGRIRGLFPEGSLDPLTRLVLVNAVYFKGSWENRFDPALTAEADFTGPEGGKLKVPMMALKGERELQYGEDAQKQVLRLPYKGGGLAMLVLLPKEGVKLSALEAALTPEALEAARKELYTQKVRVFLPKFTFGYGLTLNEPLAALGMPTAFTDKADFSGMDGKKDLYVQKAFHKAFVEVTEEGTEAAAATGAAMGVKSIVLDYAVFRADRPFLFVIEQPETGLILFIGRVEDPARKQ
ncbi:MAG: serpin family protein [Elusimicrobia bacterium]|nr:serpin family protein [Elusimicrobiota bacterium]